MTSFSFLDLAPSYYRTFFVDLEVSYIVKNKNIRTEKNVAYWRERDETLDLAEKKFIKSLDILKRFKDSQDFFKGVFVVALTDVDSYPVYKSSYRETFKKFKIQKIQDVNLLEQILKEEIDKVYLEFLKNEEDFHLTFETIASLKKKNFVLVQKIAVHIHFSFEGIF